MGEIQQQVQRLRSVLIVRVRRGELRVQIVGMRAVAVRARRIVRELMQRDLRGELTVLDA